MSDFGWYFSGAKSIAAGAGFAEGGVPTAFWPVGWPAFLGGLLFLFGPHAFVGQCANLILSTCTIGLTAVIAKRFFPGNSAWRAAIFLIAVYPNQIAYVPSLSVEIFFQFLLLLGFVLLMSGSGAAILGSGVVFGVAALTKSQGILVPIVLTVPLFACDAKWVAVKRWLRTICLLGTTLLLVILPWTARNYLVFHTFIPISTNGGFTLLTGNNPNASGGYTTADPLVTTLPYGPQNQIQLDRMANERAWQWIRHNPGRFLMLIPKKISALWLGDGEGEWIYQMGYTGYNRHILLFRSVRTINQIFYIILMITAAASLPRIWQKRKILPAWCFSGWALIGYFTLISIVFSGQSRFHFSLMPFVAIYAAWAILAYIDKSEFSAPLQEVQIQKATS